MGRPDALALVRRMTAALAHRGPDGEGYYSDGRVALGHRRLAILDPTPGGAQPMRSRDGRWTLVLNGEIFNHQELRAELGGEFRSRSDTEALLEACAAWGVERALNRSMGMFALALWDSWEGELTLARDRCGEKPLLYYWDGATFAFASELKALGVVHSSRLDPAAVDAYLALGYVPAPLAIFRDCRKLPAGHLLRFRDRTLTLGRWWFPEKAAAAERPLRELVGEAVRLRLHADTPIALWLSGGVDSSVIASECARQGASVAAFTAALEGDGSDAARARIMAGRLGLEHHVIQAGCDPARQLEDVAARYDEPFADSSALPALALARAIGGQFKVILNGDGGDEAFAGYPHYQRIGTKQVLKAAAAAAGFRDGAGAAGVYVQSKTLYRLKERARLMGSYAPGDTLSVVLDADEFLRLPPPGRGGALHRALWSDRHLYLPNDLTYKTDIAVAAYGMEGRAPFLDHRILEWPRHVPARDLVRGVEKKVALRQAYAGELPSEVLDAPKRGFGAPLDRWLAGPLREIARESLPCPLLQEQAQSGESGQRQWTLLAFARWARHWGARW